MTDIFHRVCKTAGGEHVTDWCRSVLLVGPRKIPWNTTALLLAILQCALKLASIEGIVCKQFHVFIFFWEPF